MSTNNLFYKLAGKLLKTFSPFLSDTIYQYFGKFLPINKNKTIESVLAGSKLH